MGIIASIDVIIRPYEKGIYILNFNIVSSWMW
jgi:hypothetical protein